MKRLFYVIAALGCVAALLNAMADNFIGAVAWWLAAGIWVLNAELAGKKS